MVGNDYFFLRLSMAASKATADAARDVEGSSVVTAMTFSCREFAIRVSGLGDEWFRCELPDVDAKLFEGHTRTTSSSWAGRASSTRRSASAASLRRPPSRCRTTRAAAREGMIENTERMYGITAAEHPVYKIPALGFRGTPVGIDVPRVVETGVLPVMDIGVAGRDGGQIGAGLMAAPIECFNAAAAAYAERYPT